MNKLFLVISFVLCLFSCSKNVDSQKRVKSLTPPSWIHGNWRYLTITSNNTTLTNNGYNFLYNDVCEVFSINTICLKASYENETNFYFIENIKNNYEYKFSVTRGNITTQYYFTKVDENRIRQIEGTDFSNAFLEKI